ncbi:MAG: polyphenol oxidase family protein [Myxococcaceae bacterium]|nr:polyphenol oxidase family protein [Myxococcaceae bacterium]MBH2006375.1 polyphenol oxidase family protein [Myxococcaceae bacterium]
MKFQNRHEWMSDVFLLNQVHGDRLWRVHESSSIEEVSKIEGDALWTTVQNRKIGVRTADCVPVFVWGNQQEFVCAIHAGWRGVAAHIVRKSVQAICQELGLEASDCSAQIGPCIGADVYEVGAEVARQAPAVCVKTGLDNRNYLDLQQWLLLQMQDLGIRVDSIVNRCTFSNPETYFSARRGDKGRQISWICLSQPVLTESRLFCRQASGDLGRITQR